jgi:amino acid permease
MMLPPANGSQPVTGVVFNLVNTVIGVGVLSIPVCFRRSGLILGGLMLAFLGFFTEQTLMLLVKTGDIYKTSTYSETVSRVEIDELLCL